MITETLTYVDFGGTERTEDFYFNLTEAEVLNLSLSKEGGMEAYIKKIVNAKSQLELVNALAQLIVTVCNVIVQCSEPIGQALFTLGTVAIQTIIDLIAWAWDGGGGEGGGIKGALSSLWANITSFIGEKFNPANWFKEGSLLDGLFGAANKAADERDATEYGKSVGDKLAEGMNNSQKDVRESSVNLAKTVEDATRETAGINSPTLTRRL